MQKLIFGLLAALPAYASLFCKNGAAASLIVVLGIVLYTIFANVFESEKEWHPTIRLMGLIQIIGVFIVIAWHNI